jgi:hypothetical protein
MLWRQGPTYPMGNVHDENVISISFLTGHLICKMRLIIKILIMNVIYTTN